MKTNPTAPDYKGFRFPLTATALVRSKTEALSAVYGAACVDESEDDTADDLNGLDPLLSIHSAFPSRPMLHNTRDLIPRRLHQIAVSGRKVNAQAVDIYLFGGYKAG